MMFLLGLVYLYDADMQYRNRNLMHDLLVGNETTRGVDMEFGCNSTLYLAATEVDSSQAPLTALCLDALTSPSNYSSDSPDLYIYLTASRPYLALSSILFSYTLIVLTLAVFRTSRKIMRCVNEGNAFVERYLSAKMNRNGPWSSTRYPTTLLGCGCTICSWTSAYQPHYPRTLRNTQTQHTRRMDSKSLLDVLHPPYANGFLFVCFWAACISRTCPWNVPRL
ncbi:hypothetical protein BT96DRAFT_362981 [Gymnopus androsaceus JB14]|uniref:Uncharacterized protein n=1 Tax=Gymnopus androsaceus JB14 TaxID=1447944 RepID=A0A6A4GVY9_9AGAR|nr:hypothetical protein BT96DRAFT_362981 [Gymnopus androsaceus JB14]